MRRLEFVDVHPGGCKRIDPNGAPMRDQDFFLDAVVEGK